MLQNLLVHICCSVDSHYFLQKLKQDLPDTNIAGYFYDPNIHPYSEFMLRYLDVKRSCDKLGIELYCGDYDYEQWLSGTKGLEDEPEKGKRCSYCFDFRVGSSAKKAKELGFDTITTTLLMSPKKDFNQLITSLNNASDGLEIYAKDYRINGGTNEQFALAKKDKLYHQNYCGCIFALEKQRHLQKQPAIELMSDVNGLVLPGSIESRIELYKKITNLEKDNIDFDVQRNNFLNYRLLWGLVKINSKTVNSYFLPYSNFKREYIKFTLNEVSEFKNNLRDGIIFISISRFNNLAKSNFNNACEIYKLGFEKLLKIRQALCGEMSLNPIIILDEIIKGKYEIYSKSELFYDSQEKIILENE